MKRISGFTWRREREEGGERSEACERGKNWHGFRASECDARGSTRKRRKGREGWSQRRHAPCAASATPTRHSQYPIPSPPQFSALWTDKIGHRFSLFPLSLFFFIFILFIYLFIFFIFGVFIFLYVLWEKKLVTDYVFHPRKSMVIQGRKKPWFYLDGTYLVNFLTNKNKLFEFSFFKIDCF